MKRPKGDNSRVTALDETIGERIRSRRLMVKLTQQELGQAIGVTFQQIQKYEKGQNRISGSRLVNMAKVLQCSPSHLLHENSDADIAVPDRAAADMLELFNRLHGPVRRKVVELLELILAAQDQAQRRG